MAIQVKDNYLDKDSFKTIKETISSDMFPWFYNDKKVYHTGKDSLFDYQFTHLFYQDFKINSQHFEILNPLLFQMNVKALVRVKANLNPISDRLIEYDKHEDQEFKCKGAIYYINSNNGYTMFDNEKVESKENRIVFFDTDTKHFGTNSTNCKNRMVINFNYF
tara:strand:+ start:127 stop:615 length:489 start_codon:yes stop_codon:yes gene_type:complete